MLMIPWILIICRQLMIRLRMRILLKMKMLVA